MNSSISKRQSRWIENMIEEKKEDDRKSLSEQETILDMFLPVKVGVREHGLTAFQIASRLGKGHDYKSL